MVKLYCNLFGDLEVGPCNGPACTIRTKKAQALLAYLMASKDARKSRETLASLLWADHDDRSARINLRQTLSRLRRQLGPLAPVIIEADGDYLSISNADLDVDVHSFARLVKEGTFESLCGAAALYKGDFLTGLTVDAPEFEAWQASERQRLLDMAIDAYSKLLAHRLERDCPEVAAETAAALLKLDPYDEYAHRSLMQIYRAGGRRNAALRQYDSCAGLLQRNFNIEPERATKALYEAIKTEPAGAEIWPSRPTAPNIRNMWLAIGAAINERTAACRGPVLNLAVALSFLLVTAVTGLKYSRDPEANVEQKVAHAEALLREDRWVDKPDVTKARGLLIEALALDPGHADAHAKLGYTYWLETSHLGWGAGPYELEHARSLALKAIALDNSAAGHRLLAKIHLYPVWQRERDHDSALAAARTAIALEPNNPDALADYAEVLLHAGRPKEALAFIARAKRLSPTTPKWYRIVAGQGFLLAGQFDMASKELMPLRAVSLEGCSLDKTLPLLAASLALEGRTQTALEVLRPYIERYPTGTLSAVTSFFKTFRRQRDIDLILRGVAMAGMPQLDEAL